jgi:hypothetical protein
VSFFESITTVDVERLVSEAEERLVETERALLEARRSSLDLKSAIPDSRLAVERALRRLRELGIEVP